MEARQREEGAAASVGQWGGGGGAEEQTMRGRQMGARRLGLYDLTFLNSTVRRIVSSAFCLNSYSPFLLILFRCCAGFSYLFVPGLIGERCVQSRIRPESMPFFARRFNAISLLPNPSN